MSTLWPGNGMGGCDWLHRVHGHCVTASARLATGGQAVQRPGEYGKVKEGRMLAPGVPEPGPTGLHRAIGDGPPIPTVARVSPEAPYGLSVNGVTARQAIILETAVDRFVEGLSR